MSIANSMSLLPGCDNIDGRGSVGDDAKTVLA